MRPPCRLVMVGLVDKGSRITRGEMAPLPQTTGAHGLGPGEAEALWFNGALGLVKANALQTDGRFAAVEFLASPAAVTSSSPGVRLGDRKGGSTLLPVPYRW